MTDINKKRINLFVSFILASIIANFIKTTMKFTYKASVDGWDFRIVLSFLIMFIPLIIFYYAFDKLFFNINDDN